MNFVDAIVTEVIGDVWEAYGKYWQKVKINAHGNESTTTLMFKTLDAANNVRLGYKVLV